MDAVLRYDNTASAFENVTVDEGHGSASDEDSED